jgi:DNA (cytosine-5)-methyltransferase 1
MTPREYARLMGVPDSYRIASVSQNQALFGFGDAVCVPGITWIARHYLSPLLCSSDLSRPDHPASDVARVLVDA